MTLQRMDNVLIVVEDLEAAKAFFAELGMELEGETTVEGPSVDQTVGLNDVRADIAMMRTPDGHGRVELSKFHTPPAVRAEPQSAPANALGIRRIMFAVDDIDDVVARLRQPRRRARRRDRAVRGQLPALLPARPRGHHHRTGRAARLKAPPVRLPTHSPAPARGRQTPEGRAVELCAMKHPRLRKRSSRRCMAPGDEFSGRPPSHTL
jgi:catechol 2,3-dioxygenase-like lactoylglutathione lyase family enzyme